MKKNIHPSAWRDERGMVMIIILMILMAVSLLGMASMLVVGTDIRIAGNYKDSAQAFWAAEGGVQRALSTLSDDRSYVGDIAAESLDNHTISSAEVTSLSGFLTRVVGVGRNGSGIRKVEVLINTDSAFESAINVGGDVHIAGKPRISSEGVRVNGNVYLDLDNGTPELNLYMPSGSTLTAEGDTSSLTRTDKEAMDLAAIKLREDEWRSISSTANSSWYFDTDHTYGSNDTNVTFSNLDFDNVQPGADGNRAIFVDGNVTLNGSLDGVGTIIATGKIIATGGFVSSSADTTVTMIARDDVLINFDTNAQSQINGLVYTEGDYELHGKVKFTGVVTAFGSVNIQNPSEFTNNNDPNFWYTYSPAYNVIADPIDILSWTEIN